MTGQQFVTQICRQLKASETNAQRWIVWAEECVESGQYAGLIERPKEEAVAAWLDYYYASLYFIKAEYGTDTAKQVIDLSAENLCLYPYEMRQAAKLLQDGSTPEQLLSKVQDGLLESDDNTPTMEDVKRDMAKNKNREAR